MTDAETTTTGSPHHPAATPLALGLLGSWFLVGLHEALPVAVGEPLLLAWLRLAAEHPARMATAIALLAWALRPGRLPALAPLGRTHDVEYHRWTRNPGSTAVPAVPPPQTQ